MVPEKVDGPESLALAPLRTTKPPPNSDQSPKPLLHSSVAPLCTVTVPGTSRANESRAVTRSIPAETVVPPLYPVLLPVSVTVPATRIEPTLLTVDSGTQKNVPPPLIVSALPPPLIVPQRLTCLPAATPIVDAAVIVMVLPLCTKESLKLCSNVPPLSVMFPLPS